MCLGSVVVRVREAAEARETQGENGYSKSSLLCARESNIPQHTESSLRQPFLLGVSVSYSQITARSAHLSPFKKSEPRKTTTFGLKPSDTQTDGKACLAQIHENAQGEKGENVHGVSGPTNFILPSDTLLSALGAARKLRK